MGGRRKFLKQAGAGVLFGLAAPLLISPTCVRRPFLEERVESPHEKKEEMESPSNNKQILPIYLTHCHHWFHAALWDAFSNGFLKSDELKGTQLDHYDSHMDLGPTSYLSRQDHVHFNIAQNIKLLEKIGVDEYINFENKFLVHELNIGCFHNLGAFQGFWDAFNWYLPEWHADAEKEITRDINFCPYGSYVNLFPMECQELSGSNQLAIPVTYSQSAVTNKPPVSEKYIATVDLDFFSLCNTVATFDTIEGRQERNLLEDLAKVDAIARSVGHQTKTLSRKYHPMTYEQMLRREHMMHGFVSQNFRQDVAPKLMHICESPAYCPREHAQPLMQALVNATHDFYSDRYDVQVIDLRKFEFANDKRYHPFINLKRSLI
jgi:hypothetical protein